MKSFILIYLNLCCSKLSNHFIALCINVLLTPLHLFLLFFTHLIHNIQSLNTFIPLRWKRSWFFFMTSDILLIYNVCNDFLRFDCDYILDRSDHNMFPCNCMNMKTTDYWNWKIKKNWKIERCIYGQLNH